MKTHKVEVKHVEKGQKVPSHHFTMSDKSKGIMMDYLGTFFRVVFKLNKRGRLHGVDHITNDRFHPLERLLWFVLVISTIFSGVLIGKQLMLRYHANPTVVSFERDFREWKGTIPAITFCYHNRIDKEKARNVIKKFWNVDLNGPEYKYFMDYVNLVTNTTINSFRAFARFVNDKRLEYVDMAEIALQVQPDMNAYVASFDPSFNPAIEKIMTERGVCYTVNGIFVSTLLNNTKAMKSTECQYQLIQCRMQLEVLDPTIEYTVHSPYDIVTYNSIFMQVGPTDEIESAYNIEETIASEKLRQLLIPQRKCIFSDEQIIDPKGYSQNYCKLICRRNMAMEMCGCSPHFYSFVGSDGKTCTPSGLFCLSNNRWLKTEECEQKCLKTCSNLIYTVDTYRKINWAENGVYSTDSNKSIIKYEILPQKIRFRRDLLFSFEDLIVSFGGIATLFIGCNLWNTFEMLYFILIIVIKYFHRIMK